MEAIWSSRLGYFQFLAFYIETILGLIFRFSVWVVFVFMCEYTHKKGIQYVSFCLIINCELAICFFFLHSSLVRSSICYQFLYISSYTLLLSMFGCKFFCHPYLTRLFFLCTNFWIYFPIWPASAFKKYIHISSIVIPMHFDVQSMSMRLSFIAA